MPRSTALLFILISLCAFAQTGTITVDGLERTYTLRLPTSYNGSAPIPLVIAMHGGFGSGTQLENQSQLTPKGEAEGFILVYPDGYPSPISIRTWNAGGCCGYAMNQNINDVGFISALLDQLIATHNIDTLRIYATGMSNGGFMSYRLACELSERIAAIAPVSASMTIASCQPARPVPVISFHSYLDTSVPWQGGIGDGISNHYNSPQDSVLNAFAAHANCAVLNDTVQHDAAMTVIRWHDGDCGSEVIAYNTQDGGHSWHGGMGTGIGDPPSQTVSANDLMWEFFLQHSLDCTSTGVINDGDERTISVYPQPSDGVITIRGSSIIRMEVLDSAGRLVFKMSSAPTDQLSCDLSSLMPGSYLMLTRSATQNLVASPIILY